MGAFGDKLRRERELRGITLAEISESTKIAKRWLQALEDEDFETLPGGVFNRGFVRAYAHFLGINEDEAVADYIAASNEQQPSEDKFPLEIHEKPKSPPLNPKRSPVPVVLAIMALVAIGGGWVFWTKHKPPQSATAAVRRSTTPAASPAGSSSASIPVPVAASSTMPAGSETPDHSEVKVPRAQAELNEENSSSQSEGSSRSKDSSASISVVIKAKQNSWISIDADGKSVWQGTLSTNDERSVTAGKELVLRTGNAAGIDVSYNGRALGTLGKDKEVRTLTFNTAGLQQ